MIRKSARKYIPLAAFVLFIIAAATSAYSAVEVTGYTHVMIPCTSLSFQHRLIALRHFSMNGREMYLVVDKDTLRTSIEHRDNLFFDDTGPRSVTFEHDTSPYAAAVLSSTSPPYLLQNGGIRNFGRDLGGAVLSVDLCPSKFPLSRYLFSGMIKSIGPVQHSLPVAIAATGLWMENHASDIKWLQSLELEGRLSITWVNHSYSHPREYRRSPRTLSKGFMLSQGVDIAKEVLLTEKRMIERDIVPSVFFRYPGLVSDGHLMEILREYGLIVLGSDAWLTKRQYPRSGSIILVHGNGHEPDGLKRFLKFIETKRNQINRGTWKLLDLRDCVTGEFRRYFDKRVLPDRMARR